MFVGSLSTTTLNLLRPYLLIKSASFAASFSRRSRRRGLRRRPVRDKYGTAFLGAPDELDEDVVDAVAGVVDDAV